MAISAASNPVIDVTSVVFEGVTTYEPGPRALNEYVPVTKAEFVDEFILPAADNKVFGTGLNEKELAYETRPVMAAETIVMSPFEVVEHGFPSLYENELNTTALLEPIAPVVKKFIFIKVPLPGNGLALKAEIIRVPGVELLTVIVMPLLSVPAESTDTSVTTDGL